MQQEARVFPTRVDIFVTVCLIFIAVGYAVVGVASGSPWTIMMSLLPVVWLGLYWWVTADFAIGCIDC